MTLFAEEEEANFFRDFQLSSFPWILFYQSYFQNVLRPKGTLESFIW
jgi:hypothetical protein